MYTNWTSPRKATVICIGTFSLGKEKELQLSSKRMDVTTGSKCEKTCNKEKEIIYLCMSKVGREFMV